MRGTAITAKFAPLYVIIYIVALEEDFLEPLIKSLGFGGGISVTVL